VRPDTKKGAGQLRPYGSPDRYLRSLRNLRFPSEPFDPNPFLPQMSQMIADIKTDGGRGGSREDFTADIADRHGLKWRFDVGAHLACARIRRRAQASCAPTAPPTDICALCVICGSLPSRSIPIFFYRRLPSAAEPQPKGFVEPRNTRITRKQDGEVARESSRMIANNRLAKISVN